MQYSLLLTALCASAALAIQVTKPDNTTTLGGADAAVIQWTSVNTDPTKFDVFLVNYEVNPPIKNLLASNVQTSAGNFDAPGLNSPPGQGYQINLVSTDSNDVAILAQSDMFTIKSSNPSGSSSSSASASSSSSASVSSSSSASASASSASSVAASASTLSTATASQSDASSTATSDSTATSATLTGSSASASSATSTAPPKPASGNMNAVSLVGLGVGGILALLL